MTLPSPTISLLSNLSRKLIHCRLRLLMVSLASIFSLLALIPHAAAGGWTHPGGAGGLSLIPPGNQ